AVMDWLLTRGDGERVEDFCEALWGFWWSQGSVSEASEWLEALLHPSVGVGRNVRRIKALTGAAVVAELGGDVAKAGELAVECLALARELDDLYRIAMSCNNLARTAVTSGDLAAARAWAEEGLERARGKPRWEAPVLATLADVLSAQEEYDAARALLE